MHCTSAPGNVEVKVRTGRRIAQRCVLGVADSGSPEVPLARVAGGAGTACHTGGTKGSLVGPASPLPGDDHPFIPFLPT
jgi:hypothetical protein